MVPARRGQRMPPGAFCIPLECIYPGESSLKVLDDGRRPERTKRSKRAPRDLVSLDKATGAARFFDRMVREIENDLGGRRQLSRIEGELIRAFAGAATTLQYLNVQVALGESSDIDLAGYATIASTMLRIGSRLGLARRPRDVTLTLGQVLRRGADND
jgi:hypothetical protein